MITTPFLHFGNKDLEEIKLIVTSIKAAKMVKQTTSQIVDLAMMAKKRSDSYQLLQKLKHNKKSFNCGKKRDYA